MRKIITSALLTVGLCLSFPLVSFAEVTTLW